MNFAPRHFVVGYIPGTKEPLYGAATTTTTAFTTFSFCLTGLFSRDHSRLGRVPRRSPTA